MRRPAFRSRVDPVPAGQTRPCWRVMVPTYHCVGFPADTLRAVLAHDPGPEAIQTEVMDRAPTRDSTCASTAFAHATQRLRRREWVGAFNQFRESFRLGPKVAPSRWLGAW